MLNWHFDRSEFTTTLLLRAPDAGGEFQYRSGLRTPADPNLDGVARLLDGRNPEVRSLALADGTLIIIQKIRRSPRSRQPALPPALCLRGDQFKRPFVIESGAYRLHGILFARVQES